MLNFLELKSFKIQQKKPWWQYHGPWPSIPSNLQGAEGSIGFEFLVGSLRLETEDPPHFFAIKSGWFVLRWVTLGNHKTGLDPVSPKNTSPSKCLDDPVTHPTSLEKIFRSNFFPKIIKMSQPFFSGALHRVQCMYLQGCWFFIDFAVHHLGQNPRLRRNEEVFQALLWALS